MEHLTNFESSFKNPHKDELLVQLVKQESVIWKRNHEHFKNLQMKESAWKRVGEKINLSAGECERRFKSIRESEYRLTVFNGRNVH